MHQHVVVSFGENREFDFKVDRVAAAAPSAAAARQWFDEEFVALEADVPSPIGKVLQADRVLAVAKYSGERRFRDDPQWAKDYAKNAAALLDRDFIRVDVANYIVGY
jgi:hypothetical protein